MITDENMKLHVVRYINNRLPELNVPMCVTTRNDRVWCLFQGDFYESLIFQMQKMISIRLAALPPGINIALLTSIK